MPRLAAFILVCFLVFAAAHDDHDDDDHDDGESNWKKLHTRGNPPSQRDDISAVAFGNDIYCIGGFRENLDPTNPNIPNLFFNDVFRFRTGSKQWTQLNPQPDSVHGFPVPRAFPTYGKHGNEIFYGFGITYTSSFTDITTYNDLWTYNVNTNKWRMIRANNNVGGPEARAEATAHINNGKLYMFGGVTSFFSTIADTWVYNIATNVWTQLTAGPQPSGRYGTFSALDEDSDRMYMYGGERSVFTDTGVNFEFAGPDAFWYLDLSTKLWVAVDALVHITDRTNGNGAVWHEDLFMIFGGDTGGGPSCPNAVFQQNNDNQTWAFNSNTATWNRLCPKNAPPNVKRAASVLVDDKIYLFGGFAFDSAHCGPFTFNQNVWAYSITGCQGGKPCAAI